MPGQCGWLCHASDTFCCQWVYYSYSYHKSDNPYYRWNGDGRWYVWRHSSINKRCCFKKVKCGWFF
uniref:Uncharacterized protein n=1 Tax=uncultured marine virus TaxID=186617 RepID=A0A0F7L682_9VIRU|nr:hypothetical protein [uncultured marine virus]